MKQNEVTYEVPEQPRQLRLDTTTRCNAICMSCHRHNSTRVGEMDGGLLVKILDDVKRWNIPLTEIIPVNYGEFFLNDNRLWILKMIESKLPNTKIVIPTNGSLLNEEVLKGLAEIKTLHVINLSVNAFFEDTYKKFTGLNPDILNGMPNMVRAIKALRPDVTVWASMVFSPQYMSDLERDYFVAFWHEQQAAPQLLTASSANRSNMKLIQRIAPCRSIFSDIVVGYDGKLSSCCWDADFTLDLGHYSGDLRKDWQNEELTKLREKHNRHKRSSIGLCKKCSFA